MGQMEMSDHIGNDLVATKRKFSNERKGVLLSDGKVSGMVFWFREEFISV